MIRAVTASDLAKLTELTGQLGYATTQEAISRRLAGLLASEDHSVWVAEADEVGVVGWIHVGLARTLENDPRAEIYGLVVHQDHRNAGWGARLVERALAWAAERGLSRVRVRTNIVREDAQRFYRRLGFTHTKSQQVLDR